MRVVKPSERQRLLKRAGMTGMSPREQQERKQEINFRLNLERIRVQQGRPKT